MTIFIVFPFFQVPACVLGLCSHDPLVRQIQLQTDQIGGDWTHHKLEAPDAGSNKETVFFKKYFVSGKSFYIWITFSFATLNISTVLLNDQEEETVHRMNMDDLQVRLNQLLFKHKLLHNHSKFVLKTNSHV